ncbi:MAG: AsmA-like C-terminal region-containing protein [Pseudomonadota bacterium]
MNLFTRSAIFVVASLAMIWLLIPTFVSTDFVRNFIEREITSISGQRVTLGGTTAVKLFPVPSASLQNVRFYRMDMREGDSLIAHVETLNISMSLPSVLRGKPVVSSIELVSPEVTLMLEEGLSLVSLLPLSNVRDALQALTDVPVSGDEVSELASQIPSDVNRRIGTLTVSDGTVSINAPTEDKLNHELDRVNGTLTWADLSSPLSVTAAFVYRERAFEIQGSSQSPLALLTGSIAPIAFSINSILGQMQFDGEAGVSAGLYAKGDITASSASLRNLLLWSGRRGRPALALGEVDVSANLQLRDNVIRMDDLSLTLDDNIGTGIIELSDRDDSLPTISGTLDFAALNLRSFLGAFLPIPNSFDNAAPVSTVFMDQLSADLRISATRANFDQMQFANVAATAQITPGLALFDIGFAEGYGGTLQARLRLDRSEYDGRTEVSVLGEQINMSEFNSVHELAPIVPSGRGDFAVTLTSSLGPWSNLLQRGEGKIRLSTENGAIAGLDPQVLTSYLENRAFKPIDLDYSSASFDSFQWETEISNGVLSLADAVAEFGDEKMSFSGIVQIAGGTIAASMRKISSTDDTDPIEFFIGGGTNAPYIFPSLAQTAPPLIE